MIQLSTINFARVRFYLVIFCAGSLPSIIPMYVVYWAGFAGAASLGWGIAWFIISGFLPITETLFYRYGIRREIFAWSDCPDGRTQQECLDVLDHLPTMSHYYWQISAKINLFMILFAIAYSPVKAAIKLAVLCHTLGWQINLTETVTDWLNSMTLVLALLVMYLFWRAHIRMSRNFALLVFGQPTACMAKSES